jgi:hypothetical protein
MVMIFNKDKSGRYCSDKTVVKTTVETVYHFDELKKDYIETCRTYVWEDTEFLNSSGNPLLLEKNDGIYVHLPPANQKWSLVILGWVKRMCEEYNLWMNWGVFDGGNYILKLNPKRR